MKILCIIPARIASSRLPQKMLAIIQGRPMVVRTFKGAQYCKDIDRIIVATDSDKISKILKKVGAEVMMTPKNLSTGSDRVAYIAKKFPKYNTIVNLQGDEPFIKPEMLSDLISPFKKDNPPLMSTMAFPILTQKEYKNPNFVKVILDTKENAISFSRAPIPYSRIKIPTQKIPALHHVGLYAYQRNFLLQYTHLSQTSLEKIEMLEQLRVLEHGYDIRVIKTHHRTMEINTLEELKKAQFYKINY